MQSDCCVHCLLRLPSNHISRIYGLEFASRPSGGLRLTLWTRAKKELAYTGAAVEEAHRLVLRNCWRNGRQRSAHQAEWSALHSRDPIGFSLRGGSRGSAESQKEYLTRAFQGRKGYFSSQFEGTVNTAWGEAAVTLHLYSGSSEGWMLVPTSDSHLYSAQEEIQAQETG